MKKTFKPTIYQSLVDKLLYLPTTRPNLIFLTNLLSWYMTSPSKIHFGVGKHVLRYLRGTLNFRIWFEQIMEVNLYCYCNSNWTRCVDNSNSMSSYIFSLDFREFYQNSKKQENMAQSIAKKKYFQLEELLIMLFGSTSYFFFG